MHGGKTEAISIKPATAGKSPCGRSEGAKAKDEPHAAH